MLKDILNETGIELKVRGFLATKKYPSPSIQDYAPLYVKGDLIQPDILIADPERDTPLAVIEIVRPRERDQPNVIAQKLVRFMPVLETKGVAVFACVVDTANKSEPRLQFHQLSSDGTVSEIDKSVFPSFEELSARMRLHALQSFGVSSETAGNRFDLVCRILAGIAFALLITDFLVTAEGFVFLTWERLSLIAALMILIALPYAARFKLLGFEFERLKKPIE